MRFFFSFLLIHNKLTTKKVDKDKIVEIFKSSLDNFDTQLKKIVKYHIEKIYADNNGSFTVNVGVHLDGSPSGQCVICTTFEYKTT